MELNGKIVYYRVKAESEYMRNFEARGRSGGKVRYA